MRDYAWRKAKRDRFTRRRFNAWNFDPFCTRHRWMGEPSRWFLLLDARLYILWLLKRFLLFSKQLRWAESQHCCSCPLCTTEKRKNVGNSLKGVPIQERKQRDGMKEPPSDIKKHWAKYQANSDPGDEQPEPKFGFDYEPHEPPKWELPPEQFAMPDPESRIQFPEVSRK